MNEQQEYRRAIQRSRGEAQAMFIMLGLIVGGTIILT